MADRSENIKVFNDTMEWIAENPKLSASIDAGKKGTKVYFEDDYPSFEERKTCDTEVSVTGDRSFQAAMRLRRENPDAKIAVMNFANAFHAGGGVTKGSNAQEESLCRTSTLYPLIYRKYLKGTYYKRNNSHRYLNNNAKGTDALVYTPGVIVCKTDEDLPQRMPESEWVEVDVITIAAPDLRQKSNPHAPLVGNGTCMTEAEQFGYHVRRAIHMLTCAAAEGAEILVLGAFGCGAFRNNPDVVSRAYKVALEIFPNVFKKIEFAVYCTPRDGKNYEAFKKNLG
ncbi:MAG: TIGR02452 family protein [Firmicutes bacterium]|nr:TIGR02452 family protein [Bacillota bacterium]